MIIDNRTRISTNLIKRVMRLAQCSAENCTLIITHDLSDDDKHGYFTGCKEGYIINVSSEGDIITLGHELRHLAQVQRLGVVRFNKTDTDILEDDAERFEDYLLTKGY